MKLKELLAMLSMISGRFVLTALTYGKESKEYISFRTVLEIEPECYRYKDVIDFLDEDILECEVTSVQIYRNGECWIDIIEWI